MNGMKLTKIFLAVIALLTIACNNNGGGSSSSPAIDWGSEGTIVGEWNLNSWADSTEARPQIYIAFNEDGTFELYQQQYSVVWLRYSGTYTLTGRTLKGSYTDGTPWACDYEVDYGTEGEAKYLKLTSATDSADVAIYGSCEIPTEIVDESRDPEAVRSVAIKRFL
jgi:hypothetical protein